MLVIGEEGTRQSARTLAGIVVPGDCIALHGDLGAGKTLFTESFVKALHGGDVSVISPTFNLLQTYEITLLGEETTLWHYDLYRLEEAEELEELALEDALDGGVCIIEWPEIAAHLLPKATIHVIIDFTENPENRNITLRSSEANRPRLERARL